MGCLLRSVPKEMWQMLGSKKMVKDAWAPVKSMRVGAERVKEANAQRLLKEFENIAFCDGESVDDFTMRINALAADLRTSREAIEDTRVVKKMLRVLPQRYAQITILIKTLLEELVDRLWMAEDRIEVKTITDKAGWLLLMEEDWVSRNRHRLLSESSSSSGGEKKSGYSPGKSKNGGHGDKKDSLVKLTSEGTPRRKGRCRNCGIYGHWREDCKRPPKKERKEEAHVARAEQENPSLLLATVAMVRVHRASFDVESVGVRMTHQVVHLNEKKVFPADYDEDKNVWVLDTGASNHMTGRCEALASLDVSVRGTVHFGDGSLVEIEGIGSVVLQMKKEGHKVLTEVYYIPKQKSNIVSLGQLEEGGCKVVMENGYCNVYDVERLLLAHAPRVSNRLYLLKMHLATPVCLKAKTDDQAWLWHGQYGDLNFRALRELGQKGMVEGIPLLDHAEEVCDGCALGKHQ
jgi:hypothetical protein